MWHEIRGASGALLGRLDPDRMLIELFDRRAKMKLILDLTDEAIEFSGYELARRRERIARLSQPVDPEPAPGPHGKTIAE